MSPLKERLTQLEARLQALVEGGAARLFPGGRSPHDLGGRLTAAMRAGIRAGPDGAAQAPNLYILLLHPGQAATLQADQALLDELRRALQQAGLEAGLSFAGPLVVRVEAEPRLAPGELRVLARDSLEGLSQTTDLAPAPGEAEEPIPQGAFLIVDGKPSGVNVEMF